MAECSKPKVPRSRHVRKGVYDVSNSGGICAICLEPTCLDCLRPTYDRDPTSGKRRLSFVCSSCRKSAAVGSQRFGKQQ